MEFGMSANEADLFPNGVYNPGEHHSVLHIELIYYLYDNQ